MCVLMCAHIHVSKGENMCANACEPAYVYKHAFMCMGP